MIRLRLRRDPLLADWGYPVLSLPGGVDVWTRGNTPNWIVLISRHPRWSITWLWCIDLFWGARPGGTYWQKRWGFSLGYPTNNPRGINLALGPIILALRRQHAMPRRRHEASPDAPA
jgi:hypothetical protein